uniref:Uncharacterized protein n=1 Tax=Podoviridae sp. ct8mF2 TaxID=2825224 RepID=A0A8S5PKY6_9CAUD|nr:MAG TPA: hypothetical protein [Podoviridae sp. ct8mF2]
MIFGVPADCCLSQQSAGFGCFFVQPAPRLLKESLPAHCRGLKRCKTFNKNHRRRPHSRLTVCLLYSTSWVFFSGGICLRLFDISVRVKVEIFDSCVVMVVLDSGFHYFHHAVADPRGFISKIHSVFPLARGFVLALFEGFAVLKRCFHDDIFDVVFQLGKRFLLGFAYRLRFGVGCVFSTHSPIGCNRFAHHSMTSHLIGGDDVIFNFVPSENR